MKETAHYSLTILIVGLSVVVIFIFGAPRTFLSNSTVEIPTGATVDKIASDLKTNGLIRSDFVFKMFAVLSGRTAQLQSGKYLFEKPTNVFCVLRAILTGDYGFAVVKIRIPEGATRKMMAEIFKERLQDFDEDRFLELTKGEEGFLFPDTYFFSLGTDEGVVAEILRDTFRDKLSEVMETVEGSGRSLKDIITMASIVEKEAHTDEDRRLIAGILWKRIDINMPLQVDAPFLFLLGKSSAELTRDDLEINSPFNTYKNFGLPPGPIGSPGLDAIEASLAPKNSEYLFYLSDSEGNTHYAETFEQHKTNKQLYL